MSRHDTDRDGNGLPFPYEDRTAPMQVPPVVQRQSDKPKRNGSGWLKPVAAAVLLAFLGFLGTQVVMLGQQMATTQNDLKWIKRKLADMAGEEK